MVCEGMMSVQFVDAAETRLDVSESLKFHIVRTEPIVWSLNEVILR